MRCRGQRSRFKFLRKSFTHIYTFKLQFYLVKKKITGPQETKVFRHIKFVGTTNITYKQTSHWYFQFNQDKEQRGSPLNAVIPWKKNKRTKNHHLKIFKSNPILVHSLALCRKLLDSKKKKKNPCGRQTLHANNAKVVDVEFVVTNLYLLGCHEIKENDG